LDDVTPYNVATQEISRLLGPSLLVVAIVCYFRRREAIGGWFLAFLVWVYAGLAVSLLRSLLLVARLFPSAASPTPPLIGPLALVVILTVFGYIGTAVVATFLPQVRDALWVKRLRFAIGAQLMFSGIVLVVDAAYSPTALVSNILRWSVGCIWLIYLCVSVRVRMVFVTKDWGPIPVKEIFG
jgi:hypothetical protein